jgi:hypothetical protein
MADTPARKRRPFVYLLITFSIETGLDEVARIATRLEQDTGRPATLLTAQESGGLGFGTHSRPVHRAAQGISFRPQ